MSALVLILFPMILGSLRIILTVAGWMVWLSILAALLTLLCLVAR